MRIMGRIILAAVLTAVLGMALSGCQHKPTPRVPLELKPGVSASAISHTGEGTQAYQAGRFAEAKEQFQAALASAPDSGEAHYNLGLALFALGEADQAREQFIEGANLAPGNKVIWDSPALRPYGSPEPVTSKPKADSSYSNQRPTFGGGPRR
jgi:tetratricopeptide (TPR) repeat protein